MWAQPGGPAAPWRFRQSILSYKRALLHGLQAPSLCWLKV